MKRKRGVVVLLEGSEQCGKTVLAQKIMERFKADYLHGDRPVDGDFFRFHTDMTDAAINMARTAHVVILDRCYVSHEVYGNLFDGGTDYDTHSFHDDFVDELGYNDAKFLLVYCRPDREFDPNLREEMYDDSDGNIQGNFDEVIPTYSCEKITYNWKKDPSGESVLSKIEELRNEDEI